MRTPTLFITFANHQTQGHIHMYTSDAILTPLRTMGSYLTQLYINFQQCLKLVSQC